jgi:hypothetical protein
MSRSILRGIRVTRTDRAGKTPRKHRADDCAALPQTGRANVLPTMPPETCP